MSELRTAHTADLDATVLEAARALLYDVFGDELEESDWEHALGGVHAVIWDGDELIGHASVVMRRMLHGGRALRCGYVEAVAVRADHQRRGHGGALMEAVERVIRGPTTSARSAGPTKARLCTSGAAGRCGRARCSL